LCLPDLVPLLFGWHRGNISGLGISSRPPKNIRIHDCLPTRTTCHRVESRPCVKLPRDHDMFANYIESAKSRNNHSRFGKDCILHPSMIILRNNITGLAILSTCREVATKARLTLEQKVQSIRSSPIQIIINGFALDGEDFTWLFRRLGDSRCGVSNDVRELAQPRRDGHRWDVFEGEHSVEQRHNLDVVFHMALFNAKEKAACEVVQSLGDNLHNRLGDDGPFSEIKRGADIDSHMWQSEWVEGEQYLVG
jgi:hypothetical protein